MSRYSEVTKQVLRHSTLDKEKLCELENLEQLSDEQEIILKLEFGIWIVDAALLKTLINFPDDRLRVLRVNLKDSINIGSRKPEEDNIKFLKTEIMKAITVFEDVKDTYKAKTLHEIQKSLISLSKI